MNRIETIFTQLRATGQKALMPFVTAAYPNLATTAAILPAIENAGASICELGIPFSDPVADGPVIQASMADALEQGASLDHIFEMVATVRPKLNMGMVAMVSYSIIYRTGVDHFITQASQVGFDGLIIPDLSLEESQAMRDKASEAGLTLSLLIAPTTPDDRAERIAKASTGFVYLVARTGITGARLELPPDLTPRIDRLKSVTDLPITVGFGISGQEQVKTVTQVADAAIVGSALVKCITDHKEETPDLIADAAGDFVSELVKGLK